MKVERTLLPKGYHSLKVRKVKYRSDTGALNIEYTAVFPREKQGDDAVAEPEFVNNKSEFSHKTHQHLIAAINRLKLHALFLANVLKAEHVTEDLYVAIQDKKRMADLSDESRAMIEKHLGRTVIHGFNVSGEDDKEGIIIFVTYLTEETLPFNFNTPFLNLSGDEQDYRFMDRLVEDKSVIDQEIMEYMRGKKYEDGQLDIFAEQPVSGNTVEIETVTNVPGTQNEEKRQNKRRAHGVAAHA